MRIGLSEAKCGGTRIVLDVSAFTRDAQPQLVLPLHARSDIHAPLGGRHDEMLARRRVHVMHDVRKHAAMSAPISSSGSLTTPSALPVRAPVAVVRVRVGAAVFGARDARRCAAGCVQLLVVGCFDDGA